MNRILFTIPGKPKPQKRHGDRKHGGKYDPSAQDKREFNLQSRRYAPKEPITGAVLLYVVFYMPVPKSGVNKEDLRVIKNYDESPLIPRWYAGEIAGDLGREKFLYPFPFHTKRPDVDNLLKLVKDALTGLMWADDSQVQIGGAFKIYSHNPRTEIEIYWS